MGRRFESGRRWCLCYATALPLFVCVWCAEGQCGASRRRICEGMPWAGHARGLGSAMACFNSVCEAICWCCLPPTATRTNRRKKIASQSRVERGKNPELRIYIATLFFFGRRLPRKWKGGRRAGRGRVGLERRQMQKQMSERAPLDALLLLHPPPEYRNRSG